MKYLYTMLVAVIICVGYAIFDVSNQFYLAKKLKELDTTKYFVFHSYSGLGNQMFQYAASLNYAKKHNKYICILKDNKITSNFSISVPLCNEDEQIKNIYNLLKIKVFGQHASIAMDKYEKHLLEENKWMNFKGFQQDERYFKDIKTTILKEFTFKNPLSEKAQQFANKMEKENSVCVHFRRGDYIKFNYPILTQKYYDEAIEYIQSQVKEPLHLYLFSNDMNWVKNNFQTTLEKTYVEGFDDVTDMRLMSHCKNNVIANSSFSWWGAYLNDNPDKIVVAPDVWDYWHDWWAKDIVLPDWKVIPAHDIKGNSIAIMYIATGRYIDFWDGFYESMEKYFLPDVPKTYFIFTDAKDKKFPGNVEVVEQEQLKWPMITLKRFHFFNSIKNKLKDFDYIYFVNGTMRPQKLIGKEVLPTDEQKMVFTVHPLYKDIQNKSLFRYERNKMSSAYIENTDGDEYIMGGFFGGKKDDFLKMSEILQKNIDKDLENNIIAQWHDESHINRYLVDYKKSGEIPLILSANFTWPEDENLQKIYPFLQENKESNMIILDKDKFGGREYLRAHGWKYEFKRWFDSVLKKINLQK